MATLTVYASNDGYVSSSNASYATARSGGTLSASNNPAAVIVGQANNGGLYYCSEAFLSFSFAACGNILYREYWVTDVPNVYVKGELDPAVINTEFVVTAYPLDFGTSVDTTDWVAGASLTGATKFSGDTTPYAAVDQWLTLPAAASPQTPGIFTSSDCARYILYSDRQKANTAPAVGTFEQFIFYGQSTAGTTSDPYLVATWYEMDDETATNDLAGAVGPAAIWNRELSAAEVAQVMALGATIVDRRRDAGTATLEGMVRTAAGTVVPATHVRAGWWLQHLDYQPGADERPRPLLIAGHAVNMEAGENNLTIGQDWLEDELGVRLADMLAIPEPAEASPAEEAAADPYEPEASPSEDPAAGDDSSSQATYDEAAAAPVAEDPGEVYATPADAAPTRWWDSTENGGYWATLPNGEQRWYTSEDEYRLDVGYLGNTQPLT